MAAVTELATAVGTRAACLALWVPRGSYYRDRRSSSSPVQTAPRPRSGRALAAAERETILTYLHQERFQDRSRTTGQVRFRRQQSSRIRFARTGRKWTRGSNLDWTIGRI